jgi:hypothetical protein
LPAIQSHHQETSVEYPPKEVASVGVSGIIEVVGKRSQTAVHGSSVGTDLGQSFYCPCHGRDQDRGGRSGSARETGPDRAGPGRFTVNSIGPAARLRKTGGHRLNQAVRLRTLHYDSEELCR